MPKMPVARRSSVSSANLFLIASRARRFFTSFAVQADDSALRVATPKNIFQHLGAAGAVQAGEADDLAPYVH